ncbi:MAG: hypothetical protein JSU63_15050 [Phycisphaerales bacterium]|nr:MAG: hypothetical protein JSU63_15050 [Phycisphaerales bacterium]
MFQPGRSLTVRVRTGIVIGGLILSVVASTHAQTPLIIDHNCTNIAQVPDVWVEQAKSQFRLSYGHTSHGSQIVTGMTVLEGLPGSIYLFNYDGSGGELSLHDTTPPGDLGNPDYYTWATLTRDMLDAPGNDRNMVMWSWCGQADTTEANIQIYLDLMSALEADCPDVTFVYMTGHLVGTGEEGNLHQRNNQIRDHCIANGSVLFDFADIESYDPDGDYFLDLYADDGCNYTGGNWAVEWCAEHPGDDLCIDCSCAHSQPLNCNLKGRAFWWMMARLAGWPGPGGDPVNSPQIPPWPHNVRKNRYLSIDPSTNADTEVALRVDLVDMNRCSGDLRRACRLGHDDDCPTVCDSDLDIVCLSDVPCDGGSCVETGPCVVHPDEGLTLWVEEPEQEPIFCRLPGGCTDQDWLARLGDTPYARSWNDFGVSDSSVLHVSDCQVTPVATYAVRACLPPTFDTCSDPLVIGTIRKPNRYYADVVGPVDPITQEFAPPDGFTDVRDVQCGLLTNLNYGVPGAKPQAHWTWVALATRGYPLYEPFPCLCTTYLQHLLFGVEGRPFAWSGNNVDPGDCP